MKNIFFAMILCSGTVHSSVFGQETDTFSGNNLDVTVNESINGIKIYTSRDQGSGVSVREEGEDEAFNKYRNPSRPQFDGGRRHPVDYGVSNRNPLSIQFIASPVGITIYSSEKVNKKEPAYKYSWFIKR